MLLWTKHVLIILPHMLIDRESQSQWSKRSLMQALARHINCLSEENRNTRKRALEGIKKETFGRKPALENETLKGVYDEISKQLLKVFSDPVEKCRELSIALMTEYFKAIPEAVDTLPYFMPVMVLRLGQQELTEPSEELRLTLVELLTIVVGSAKKKTGAYLDDMIKILERTIVDPYPEVKKESCRCASLLARTIPEYFHMQSEALIKPLLISISHQHSKVRVTVIEAIGTVIQYGSNKVVGDVVSHLAQRMFDQAPAVRMAVTTVVGNWLLDLPDRYSFFHKLIPLLLTSITDEVPEIRQQADALWHDAGLKFGRENEDDLKDKEDFMKVQPTHYPPGIERPNLGCRTLIYRHVSKIIPACVKELSDWVAATRIKASGLLTTLLANAEDCVTQHVAVVLPGLYKGCADEEKEVVKNVVRSAELLGYFLEPPVWCKLVLQAVRTSQAAGPLMVLAAIVRGSQRELLREHLPDMAATLAHEDVCRTVQIDIQIQLLSCVESILQICNEDCKAVSLDLFTVLVTVLAMSNDEGIRERMRAILLSLASVQGLRSSQDLYSAHAQQLLDSYQDGYAMWNNHSVERLVFDALMMESGPVVGEMLDDVIPVLSVNLNPEKDAELRLKFFNLLSRLMMNAPNTLDSQQRFDDFAVTVVKDMILPNCVWKAGRTAGAIRTTAVSCLWALLKSGVLTTEKLITVTDDLMTQMKSLLEDDNNSTRLITCRVMMHIFTIAGSALDQHKLHNMYPDLLKRLDDSSDDIRVAVSKTFVAYLDCFEDQYNVDLYKAHLEEIYKGLLVHLDDPDQKIQEALLEVLMRAAKLKPNMLLKEVESVKHKHRTPKYCDVLIDYIQNKLGK